MIRRPAVSGTFYPSDPSLLKAAIAEMLEEAEVVSNSPPVAVVAPHAGYVYSGPIAAYSFKVLSPLQNTNPTVFLLGPSHFVPFEGITTGSFTAWETPLGIVPLNLDRVDEILSMGHPFTNIDLPLLREHSLEVELPFLQTVLKNFSIVPLVFGFVDPTSSAQKLLKVLRQGDVVVVSTDLSHYHADDLARRLDHETLKFALKNDAEGILMSEACGRYAWATLAAMAKIKGWKAEILAYGTSGDTSGDRSSVVGYAALRYDPP